jgi:hypothetical protein
VSIFGREPVKWLGLIAAAIQLFSSVFIPLSVDQQGALNAVAAALLGLIAAFMVSADKGVPLIAGLMQAVMACALTFNLDLSPTFQGAVMAFVSSLVAMYVRTQVTAPIDSNGNRVVVA